MRTPTNHAGNYAKAFLLAIPMIIGMQLTQYVVMAKSPTAREQESERFLTAAVKRGARFPITAKARAMTPLEADIMRLREEMVRVELSNYEILDALHHRPRGTTASEHGFRFTDTGPGWTKKADKGWKD